MIYTIYLIGGIVLIIFSANWLVNGSSAIAKRIGVSDLVVGLTIVGFGTSAPELTVTVFAAIKGSTDLAIGNILGSNISNILLILGVSAIIYPIAIKRNTQWKEIPFSLLAIVVLGIMANDIFIDNSSSGNYLTRIDGLILLCFMTIFIVYTIGVANHSMNGYSNNQQKVNSQEVVSTRKSLLFIALGLIGLFFGGKYLVSGAIEIARVFGMNEKTIGLTIIAVGTSLPELATSLVASYKKKTDIAIGNIIGSNIFNVFFILGITSLIKPIHFDASINLDIAVAIISSILLFVSAMTFRKKRLDRIEGIVFVSLYVCYIVYLLTI
jgi:cation:H+ antiporter